MMDLTFILLDLVLVTSSKESRASHYPCILINVNTICYLKLSLIQTRTNYPANINMPKHKLLFSDILAREEEAPERIKTCEELVADRVPPRVPSPVSGLSYSLIESMLPQELLVYIVDMLDSDDYLTVQFVCSRLKAATRRQDGTLKAKMNAIFDRRAYAATMAKIEAGLRPSVKLQKWTCSNCAKRLSTLR